MNIHPDIRSDAPGQRRRPAARRVRRAPRAVTIGLLALATAVGVRLGLDAPTTSPVSPAAIAARYGTPPGEMVAAAVPAEAAAPPAEVAAALPADATALTSSDAVTAAPGAATTAPSEVAVDTAQGRQRGRRDGGGHD